MTTIAVLGASRLIPDDLESAVPGDRVVRLQTIAESAVLEEAEVALGTNRGYELLRHLLPGARRLRWLHLASAGVNLALDSELANRRDLVITNSRGAYDGPVSEFALALMVAAAKRLPDLRRAQRQSRWDRAPVSSDLSGSTLVVLGLGSIGRRLALISAAMGIRVIGVRRNPDSEKPAAVSAVVGPEELIEVVADADFLAVTAPLTAKTRGLVSREVLARMKPTAWIVNVARGELIDEAALAEALEAGRLGGAAIDTWWNEPLSSESKWWHFPNVIATPHAASSSPRVQQRTLDLFLENLRRWKGGLPLLNIVDTREGY